MTNLIRKCHLISIGVQRCIFPDVFPLNITYVPVVKEIRDKWSNAGGDRYNDHMTCVCTPRCQRRPIASSGREKAARSRGQHLRQCSYQKQCSNLSAVYLARNLRPRANDNAEIKCRSFMCFILYYVIYFCYLCCFFSILS